MGREGWKGCERMNRKAVMGLEVWEGRYGMGGMGWMKREG